MVYFLAYNQAAYVKDAKLKQTELHATVIQGFKNVLHFSYYSSNL